MITSDDDDNVNPSNHDNDDGTVLPKMEMASQSGSPGSLHEAPRVYRGRRDPLQAPTRSRTPSRGRTRYRFSSLRGPSNERHPCPFSSAIAQERSPTKELPTPIIRVPALQDSQRHTLRAKERRRESQSGNHTSLERTKRSSESPILGERYVTRERLGDHKDEKQGYIPKGAFLVRKEPNSDQYRFPKASAKHQSSWVPGDGFSDAEAKPDFLFFVTGKRKRKTSPSLPGMGKLTTGMDGTKTSSIQAHGKRAQKEGAYHQKSELLRGERRDVWPTRHDFIDSTLPRRDEKAMDYCSADDFFIPSTVLSPPVTMYTPQPTSKFGNWIGKGPLDFRNFETEDAAGTNLLKNLWRVRAWREESYLCADEDADEDDDALMSEGGC